MPRLRDEEHPELRLPRDWHVPESLKPHRKLSDIEQSKVDSDFASYFAMKVVREEKRKK